MPDEIKQRLLSKADARITSEGIVVIKAQTHRSLPRNQADALARLESARRSTQRLVISCATLVRVDFSAAGGILNWVAQRQLEGCTVQFREVHRLVAAFFNVVGIHEHARVVLRSN